MVPDSSGAENRSAIIPLELRAVAINKLADFCDEAQDTRMERCPTEFSFLSQFSFRSHQ